MGRPNRSSILLEGSLDTASPSKQFVGADYFVIKSWSGIGIILTVKQVKYQEKN